MIKVISHLAFIAILCYSYNAVISHVVFIAATSVLNIMSVVNSMYNAMRSVSSHGSRAPVEVRGPKGNERVVRG